MSRTDPLILSIDDDPCVGRVLQLKLESEGFRTVRAMTAEDGLVKIRELKPDVVVTDVRLPGLSGLELCRLCEPLQEQWPFLVIVLTSQVVREDLEWIESSNLRRYVAKPFSPRALADAIRQYVGDIPAARVPRMPADLDTPVNPAAN